MQPPSMTGLTRLVPILAHPVDHVQAPRFYNPAFAAAGLDWCLVPMGVQPSDLAATLAQLARVGNLQGVNLTIPHKAAGHALCRWLGPEARRTGVVNSLRLTPEGHWVGESFDGQGFVDAARFHGLLPPAGRACIVGAGGAGTAIAFALAAAGVTSIHLIDTDRARADSLAGRLREAWPALEIGTGDGRAIAGAMADAMADSLPDALADAQLVVNATPLGLHAGDPLPLDPARLRADAGVFDIIAARDTELMAACQARGLRVIGGRPMIDHQIAAQIGFWRGEPLDLEPAA